MPKRKKTRDELIAEMKAMRAGQAAATGASEGGGGGASESRFKPIGSTGTDKKGKGKETASGGWKTVGGAGVGDDGREKKKRKKRKVVPPPTAAPAAADQTLSTAPDSATASAPSKELPSLAPTASVPAPAPVPDDDDDMDIFGDVGDYKGLDTDEESDAGGGQGGSAAAAAPATSTSTGTGTGKRKYFDDDDEEDTIGTSTAPTGLEDLAARQAAANAAAATGGAGPSAGAGAGAGAGGAEQDEERGQDRPMRLEGLSGAGPSVKELLEMDKAAEAEEKRQAVSRLIRARKSDGGCASPHRTAPRQIRSLTLTSCDGDGCLPPAAETDGERESRSEAGKHDGSGQGEPGLPKDDGAPREEGRRTRWRWRQETQSISSETRDGENRNIVLCDGFKKLK